MLDRILEWTIAVALVLATLTLLVMLVGLVATLITGESVFK